GGPSIAGAAGRCLCDACRLDRNRDRRSRRGDDGHDESLGQRGVRSPRALDGEKLALSARGAERRRREVPDARAAPAAPEALTYESGGRGTLLPAAVRP